MAGPEFQNSGSQRLFAERLALRSVGHLMKLSACFHFIERRCRPPRDENSVQPTQPKDPRAGILTRPRRHGSVLTAAPRCRYAGKISISMLNEGFPLRNTKAHKMPSPKLKPAASQAETAGLQHLRTARRRGGASPPGGGAIVSLSGKLVPLLLP